MVGGINTVKTSMLPKAFSRVIAISFKTPRAFFRELEQIIPKFIQNHNRPQIATAILRKKNKAGAITYLIPNYTTMLLSSKQHRAAVNRDMKVHRTEQRAQNKLTPVGSLSL